MQRLFVVLLILGSVSAQAQSVAENIDKSCSMEALGFKEAARRDLVHYTTRTELMMVGMFEDELPYSPRHVDAEHQQVELARLQLKQTDCLKRFFESYGSNAAAAEKVEKDLRAYLHDLSQRQIKGRDQRDVCMREKEESRDACLFKYYDSKMHTLHMGRVVNQVLSSMDWRRQDSPNKSIEVAQIFKPELDAQFKRIADASPKASTYLSQTASIEAAQ